MNQNNNQYKWMNLKIKIIQSYKMSNQILINYKMDKNQNSNN